MDASSSLSPSLPPPLRSTLSTTSITNLDEDSLAHCTAYLNLQEVCNLAMTCSHLKRVAYSDPIWHRLFREQWPKVPSSSLPTSGGRDMYLARHTAVQQFKFKDPFTCNIYPSSGPVDNLFIGENQICFSQGSRVYVMTMASNQKGTSADFFGKQMSMDHKARITCMRLFSLDEITLSRGQTQSEQNVLVTSSCDHSICLWWKGSCWQCLRGHNGPVLSLSNKLLGDDSNKVLASGGEDGTVRLWSLSSKSGEHALKATLYGHENPVNLISVAGHDTSLLVSIARDSKVRVWDTTKSSAARSSCCVGMTSISGELVNMKCHESLLYVAAGSSVTGIDLRTMQKVITAAVHQPKLYSFDILPSKSLLCTGGDGRAMLWDIRRNQDSLISEPIARLDGHCGPVKQLQMDAYKIVTGGPDDKYVYVWEADTGAQTNSFLSFSRLNYGERIGCEAMAINGCRIITATCCDSMGMLCFRNFNSATSPVMELGK